MGEERKDERGGAPGRQSASCSWSVATTKRAGEEVRTGLASRWFAWLLSHGEDFDQDLYGERKRDLLGGLSGTVVEIGPGAGVNLPYFGEGVRWIGVEPNVYFHDRLRRKAAALGIEAEVVGGIAERLGLPDASADAVVST